MTNSEEGKSHLSDTQQMEKIRQLVLGEDGHVIKQALQNNAREVVSEVFSEALHDREKQDGSVNTVLRPLVEKSVEQSIANHSQQFVNYLYPIVGSLVRKSVTAFITEFLEKTNTLLENSFTIKGIKWRLKAWQSGVTFSQYVASQTFAFRVEQVFLIHSETGLLLNSVSLGLDTDTDADLVSSMLTAINDFVSDSFKPNQDSGEQQLNVVRTNDFTLLIKQGPKAMVVAAITGNMPQSVANQLQQTLEDIHKLYDKELNEFNGDPAPFEQSQNQLQNCLISELKTEHKNNNKKPWLAWIVVAAFLIGCTYLLIKHWQAYNLLEKLEVIDNEPGILITQINTLGLNQVQLEVLRDPAAQPINEWLENQNISQQNIQIKERAYLSLEPKITQQKVNSIVMGYPNITLNWMGNQPSFSGKITNSNKLRLQHDMEKVIGLNFHTSWLDSLMTEASENTSVNDPKILKAILDMNIAKINSIDITFENSESELTENAVNKLVKVTQQFNDLVQMAEQQKLSISLIIMGTSDMLGSPAFNKTLSQSRANHVKFKLQELGIDEVRLNAVGLGVINLNSTPKDARKVLLNVVYFDTN